MADPEYRNGQIEYGTRHVTEEQMREAGTGVFEAKSGEAGTKKARAPANKAMKAAPENKADDGSVSMSMTKDELLKVAKAEGVDVETDDNKADLVAKIEKARK